MIEEEFDGTGHRARLRSRLLHNGGESLLEHELVEYLLTLAIPRRDTKPLAKKLLHDFGGLGGLFSADSESLKRIGGLSEPAAAAIKIAHSTATLLLRAEYAKAPILSSWAALLDYLRADMSHLRIERVRVLYLNSRNMLIRDEVASEGSIDETAIHVREVMRRAIDLGAASLILVHNHPSGDPQPSRADISITRNMVSAARALGMDVHDHIIIGAGKHVSLRAQGLI
jgi:DNA repair protein RadC